MKVLFLGGTGNISTACVEEALGHGHQVTLLNRGRRAPAVASRVTTVVGDRDDPVFLRGVAEAERYDAVVDFLCFSPAQVASALAAFGGRAGQYVFISSASAYRRPAPWSPRRRPSRTRSGNTRG